MALLKFRYHNGGLILHVVVQKFTHNVIHQPSGIAVMAASVENASMTLSTTSMPALARPSRGVPR